MQKRSNATSRRQNVVEMDELKRAREGRQAARETRDEREPREGAKRGQTRPAKAQPVEEEPRYYRPNRSKPHRQGGYGLLWFLLLLLLLAFTVVIGMGVFRVSKITVSGNDTVDSKEIVSHSGIREGQNIFQVSLSQAKRSIENDPMLEVKSIKRVLPDRISIVVRQRTPHGAVQYLGVYAIIDEYGYVLDQPSELPAGQYPLITGFDLNPPVNGKKLQGVDEDKLSVLTALLTALEKGGATGDITDINLQDTQDIRLLTSEGLAIVLGKATDLEEKVRWIALSLPELREKGYTSGTLYITGTGDPVYSEESVPVTGDADEKDDDNGGDDNNDDAGGQEDDQSGDEGQDEPDAQGGSDGGQAGDLPA